MVPTRRKFLAGAAAGLGAVVLAKSASAQQPLSLGRDRLVLLGTKGGPRITSYAPTPSSNLLVYRNVPYVVDAGYGVTLKLVDAGLPLPALRYIFITHHHSDHNLELGPLLYNAWASGLRQRVDAYGPVGIAELLDAYWQSERFDIDTRIADEGRPDLRKLVGTHTYAQGEVFADQNVKVTALRNVHPPVAESYALKFELGARTVVFSGDTAYFPPLAEFAKGADILVHEVMYAPALEALVQKNPNAATLMAHLKASHTLAEDVGRIAAAAEAKMLVLNHFVPGDDKSVTPEVWTAAVRTTFAGNIAVGRDLLELPL
jgi:ribonuclease BN (tRNA processing enzyme)